MFLKDGKVSRETYEKAIDDTLKKNPTIPNELLVIYKDLLADTCMTIQEQLYKQYPNEDAMIAESTKFIDDVLTKNSGMEASQGFLIVPVPMILPLEVYSSAYLLRSGVLPYYLSKISEYFVDDVFSILITITDYLNKEKQSVLSNILKSTKPYLN